MTTPAPRFPDDLTLREGRDRYFAASGFDTSGYDERWVRLPVGSVHVSFPNLEGRRRCVALHDVDHVLTGYGTDWHGESQVSAFEIGAGCGRYWFGWLVNSQGLVGGALRWPRAALAAFVRGRRCRHSVYERDGVDDALLDSHLGDLRAELGLDVRTEPPSGSERIVFVLAAIAALAANAGPLLAGVAALWWWLVQV